MWIIDFLPFWIFHLLLIAGIGGIIASQFFKFIPFVSQYAVPIKVGSIIAVVFALYMEGGIANQEKWEAKVKELEAKVAVAEEKSKTANAKLQSVVKEKTKVIKEIQLVVQDRISKEATKIDAECKVAPEVISILNQAASKK